MKNRSSNYDAALKAEAKRVVRCFHRYDHITRSNLQASHRVGHRQRESTGEYFYVHPDIPNIAFAKRFDAARRALNLPA